jgi:hypothetical protein
MSVDPLSYPPGPQRELAIVKARADALAAQFRDSHVRTLRAEKRAAARAPIEPTRRELSEAKKLTIKAKCVAEAVLRENAEEVRRIAVRKRAEQQRIIRSAVAAIEEQVQRNAEMVNLLMAAHLRVSPSLVTNRAAHGHFAIKDEAGNTVAMAESRGEALATLKAVMKREAEQDRDVAALGIDRPRRPQPGERTQPDEDAKTTEKAGRLDGARLVKVVKRRQARIL